jgi:hypothetical protein
MKRKRKKNKGGAKKTISMKFNMKHVKDKIVPSPLKCASTPKNRGCTFGNDVLFRS